MIRFAKAMVAVAALAVGAPALAQGRAHEHDGFFFRPGLGMAYIHTSGTQVEEKFAIYGGGAHLSLAVGGAMRENLILAAHLYGTAATDPKIDWNRTSGWGINATSTTSRLYGLGPQLTYYFMPANLYLSGTLALTRAVLNTNGTEGKSKIGVGGRLEVGKEWWVSDEWGLGLAGNFGLSSNGGQNGDVGRVRTWASGVSFSATYN